MCEEVLFNDCMKPSLPSQHLQTKHASYTNEECSVFHHLAKHQNMTSFLPSANKDNENEREASNRISCHIARSGKNHTIAEILISP